MSGIKLVTSTQSAATGQQKAKMAKIARLVSYEDTKVHVGTLPSLELRLNATNLNAMKNRWRPYRLSHHSLHLSMGT